MPGLKLKPTGSDRCEHLVWKAYKHKWEVGYSIRCWCLSCEADVEYVGTL